MLYGTTRSKPNQTCHFPPDTWQLYTMQQLRRYLTLKMARKIPKHRIFDGYTKFDVSKSYEQPVGFFLTCGLSFHNDTLYLWDALPRKRHYVDCRYPSTK